MKIELTPEQVDLLTKDAEKKLIDDFKRASSQKRIHLFDLERQIGIDMASFNTKLDKALKKDFSKKDQKKKIQLRFY